MAPRAAKPCDVSLTWATRQESFRKRPEWISRRSGFQPDLSSQLQSVIPNYNLSSRAKRGISVLPSTPRRAKSTSMKRSRLGGTRNTRTFMQQQSIRLRIVSKNLRVSTPIQGSVKLEPHVFLREMLIQNVAEKFQGYV